VRHPTLGTFRLNEKGYPRLNSGKHRNKYVHRAVFEEIAGRPVRTGFNIHHMNGKHCFCPHQLLEIQKELHVASEPLRCPFTGEFMKPAEFERRYGIAPMRQSA
jgi:hypothetical protein